MISINGERLISRIDELGRTGIDSEGRRTRLAASDEDKAGRDLVATWMADAGMKVISDRIGNLFGIWETEKNCNQQPMMVGSHIDTVINAGQYDGCLGVIAGIEVVKTLQENGMETGRPIVVGAFHNEEGVRYQPDMMGSLVYAGGMDIDEALASVGTDGTVMGEELKRIGYEGTADPGFIRPCAFVELHIEQGPILDIEKTDIGAVNNLQGISWYRIEIEGRQNHAGTTPTAMRIDAGLAASKVNVFMRERCLLSGGTTVCTIGTMSFEPNAVNVIPSKAVFTVDVRNPDKNALREEENALLEYLRELEETDKVKISAEKISGFSPVLFDEDIVNMVEKASERRGLSSRRITSGAGQDAQNMALLCPTAMIFIPSKDGISHNPAEFSKSKDIVNGANVFLDVVCELAS